MILFLHKAHPSLMAVREKVGPNIGRLVTPRGGSRMPDPAPYPWAVDNDAFSGFDAPRYIALLDRLADRADEAKFVVAPDVVGNHEETVMLWDLWAPYLRNRGWTPAFAVQDGALDFYDLPPDVGAVFIGGSTQFKMSPTVAAIVRDANEAGLWTHCGRVNTERRITYAASIGCDSIDGSKWSRFTDTYTHQLHQLAYRQGAFE